VFVGVCSLVIICVSFSTRPYARVLAYVNLCICCSGYLNVNQCVFVYF
jgi:hypothetical protein